MLDDDGLRKAGRSARVDEQQGVGRVDRLPDCVWFRAVFSALQLVVKIDRLVEVGPGRVRNSGSSSGPEAAELLAAFLQFRQNLDQR